MDDYTHDQYFLALVNDQPSYKWIRDNVRRKTLTYGHIDSKCNALAWKYELESLSIEQKCALLRGLREHFSQPEMQNPQPPTPSLENTMATHVPTFEIMTLVNGADIKGMTDDQLINAIKQCEAEIKSLTVVELPSTKIKSKIEQLQQTASNIRDALDAR